MHIELISRKEKSEPNRPALLFIHGAFHGAWCWDEYLLPWFAKQGWEAHAMSLRGHGQSDGKERIREWTLDDYMQDVSQTLKQLDRPVVLVGHSMGGVISEMCWDRFDSVAGMVLYAGSPLKPDLAVIWRMLRLRPFSLLAGQVLQNADLLMRATETILFSPSFDPEKRDAWHARLCLESPKALKGIFARKAPEKRAGDDRPVLVIAGTDDWAIPLHSHEAAAKAFRGDLKVCPGAHDLMLDPQWEVNAMAIHEWLSLKFPVG